MAMIDCSKPEIEAGARAMTCVEAVNKTSSNSGNKMMVLTWADEDGNTLKDYFIYEMANGKTPRQSKFRSLFYAMERPDPVFDPESCNDEGHYEEFEGLTLMVNIKVQSPIDKITGAVGYPESNIAGYLRGEE